jgi:hypothetical protein
MTTPEILVRRYEMLFSLYDSNRNGYVEEADLKRLQGQFLAAFGESPTSERGADVVKLWDGFWQAVLANTDYVADGRISLEEWRKGIARLAGDEARRNRVLTPLATSFFRLMDTDGDGKVGPAEWRSFQESTSPTPTPTLAAVGSSATSNGVG